jgi:NTE family protein
MQRRDFLSYTLSSTVLGATVLGVSGCAGGITMQDLSSAGWPRNITPPRTIAPRGLALVLGSGGPRGFAHVGVLKALEELKITPDLVVGSSVGAVIGALLAARVPAAEIEKTAINLGTWDIIDLTWQSITSRSFFTGKSVGELVARMSQQRDIAALPLPFAAAATKVNADKRYEPVIFNAGSLPLAIRASAAVVGTAPEVQIDGALYCDGDLSAPLPAQFAKALGGQRIIAVDVSAYDEDTPDWVRSDRPQWMAQAQRRSAQTKAELPAVDTYLHIRSPYFTGFSDAYRKQLIALGYEQTMSKRDALLKLSASV